MLDGENWNILVEKFQMVQLSSERDHDRLELKDLIDNSPQCQFGDATETFKWKEKKLLKEKR